MYFSWAKRLAMARPKPGPTPTTTATPTIAEGKLNPRPEYKLLLPKSKQRSSCEMSSKPPTTPPPPPQEFFLWLLTQQLPLEDLLLLFYSFMSTCRCILVIIMLSTGWVGPDA